VARWTSVRRGSHPKSPVNVVAACMTCNSEETNRLLDQAARGDPRAMEMLLARHREGLRRMVALRLDRRLRKRIDPSDVIQEASL